jgi:hypothetical protein
MVTSRIPTPMEGMRLKQEDEVPSASSAQTPVPEPIAESEAVVEGAE